MKKQSIFVHEASRDVPVVGDYDVVVVGGGIAGVSAALAASRVHGTKVCLVEKFCGLGGLATLGVVIWYLPLCDGRGHQIIGGIGEELMRLSVDDIEQDIPLVRQMRIPKCWTSPDSTIEARCKDRFVAGFNPITFMYKLERLMLKNHITLLYDTRFAGVSKENGAINAVLVETKAGRVALKCKAVVDCSGDADVCFAADEKTVSIAKNVRCGWYYFVNSEGSLELKLLSDPTHQPPLGPDGKPMKSSYSFRGDNSFEVTKQIIASRQLMMDDVAKTRREKGGNPYPVMSPTMPTHRMTRRLSAKITLKESDDHRWFDDALGMTGDWRKAGPVFCVPLRSLAATKTANLLAAGRCMATVGDTWDLFRVIPTCAVTGEAAGVAAAFFANSQDCRSIMDLDIPAMQKHIKRHHGIIDKRLLDN